MNVCLQGVMLSTVSLVCACVSLVCVCVSLMFCRAQSHTVISHESNTFHLGSLDSCQVSLCVKS